MSAVLDNRPGTAHGAPPAPRTLGQAGLPDNFVAELAVKVLFNTGPQRLVDLADRLCIAPGALDPVIDFLRAEKLVDLLSTSTGVQLVYALTRLGQERARDFARLCEYAGPAPVTLADYEIVTRAASQGPRLAREAVEAAFADGIFDAQTVERLGTSALSGRAMFLYGPAGSGKTSIAHALARAMHGEVLIPHALLVGDQVIRVFDPEVHVQALGGLTLEGSTPIGSPAPDRRWVRCERPVVVTGGELSLEMLDLQFDAGTRHYVAPPQLKANGGFFVIDDLGRQLVSARELMNRWIVPLDRGIDYLALHTGQKFQVPFATKVIFCTNIAPEMLGDDAFLRRLGYKIHVGEVDAARFRALVERTCFQLGVRAEPAVLGRLMRRLADEKRPRLACVPRDLVAQIRDRADYYRVPAILSDELLDWAWTNYFVAQA